MLVVVYGIMKIGISYCFSFFLVYFGIGGGYRVDSGLYLFLGNMRFFLFFLRIIIESIR